MAEEEKPKPIRKTDETGREILVYENGLILDAKSGHTINPPDNNINSSERGRELNLRRRELNRQAAEQGIIEAMQKGDIPNVNSPADAVRVLTSETTKIALEGKHDRDRLDAVELVTKMADLLPMKENEEGRPGLSIDMDIETLREILHAFRALKARREEDE